MNTNNLEARVDRGISFLDDVMPDWPTKINLDTLDIYEPEVCMFGQLFGGFDKGLQIFYKWVAYDDNSVNYGFCEEYEPDTITQIWKNKIQQLREVRGLIS